MLSTTTGKQSVFVGRTAEIDLCFDFLEQKEKDKQLVVSYYGIGGMGKSQLCKQLLLKLNNNPVYNYSFIDFFNKEGFQIYDFLKFLRNHFQHNHKIKFPLFDLAYVVLLSKINVSVKGDQKITEVVESSSIVSDILGIVQDLPYLSLIPKAWSIIEKTYNLASTKKYQKFIDKLYELSEQELFESLYQFFIEDMNNHIESYPDKQYIIVFDTYEALWMNKRLLAYDSIVDKWVRKLVNGLPNVSFIIFGREAIEWEKLDANEFKDVIKKVPLSKLHEEEIKELLNYHSILDEEIQFAIINNLNGYPLSIGLAIELYEALRKKNIYPTYKDFENLTTDREIFDRLMKYLTRQEAQALEALALTPSWDYDLFIALMDCFNIHFGFDDYLDLVRFSFIIEEEGRHRIHDVMRENLLKYQRKEKRIRGHEYLFNQYKELLTKRDILKNPTKLIIPFQNAFYHGFSLMQEEHITATKFVDWYREIDRYYIDTHQNYLTLSLIEQLQNIMEQRNDDESLRIFTILQYDVAYIMMTEIRNFESAEQSLQKIVSFRLKHFGENDELTAKAYYGLGTPYTLKKDYEKAEFYHLKGIKLREQRTDSYNPITHAFSANGLGLIYQETECFEEAIKFYSLAINLYEQQDEIAYLNLIVPKLNFISLLIRLNRFEEASEEIQDAERICNRKLKDYQLIKGRMLQYYAIIEAYYERFDDAVEMLDEVEELLENMFKEDTIYLAKLYHNMACIHYLMDQKRKAKSLIVQALKMKEGFVESNKLPKENPHYIQTLKMKELFYSENDENCDVLFNF